MSLGGDAEVAAQVDLLAVAGAQGVTQSWPCRRPIRRVRRILATESVDHEIPGRTRRRDKAPSSG